MGAEEGEVQRLGLCGVWGGWQGSVVQGTMSAVPQIQTYPKHVLLDLPDPQFQRSKEGFPLFGLRPALANPHFLHPFRPTELTEQTPIPIGKPHLTHRNVV